MRTSKAVFRDKAVHDEIFLVIFTLGVEGSVAKMNFAGDYGILTFGRAPDLSIKQSSNIVK